MSAPILETHALSRYFGSLRAVDDVSLRLFPGEVFGFLGPNGAGKTTTMSMLLGLTPPSAGTVTIFDRPVTPYQTAPLRQVGALIGAPALLPYLSGRQNLGLLARLYPDIGRARVDELLALVGLTGAADRPLKGYSTGMKQRLGLAAALLHHPRLVLLDEPTNGLDPAGMRHVRRLIRRLADDGTTIFLSSHLLHEVEQVCDRIAVIHHGRIVARGQVAELLARARAGVRVRVPDPAAAAALIQSLNDVTAVHTDGAFVHVSGAPPERIVAHLTAGGIVPGEVSTGRSDLEEIFFEATGQASP